MIKFNITIDNDKQIDVTCEWGPTNTDEDKLEMARLIAALMYSIENGVCNPMLAHAVANFGTKWGDTVTSKNAVEFLHKLKEHLSIQDAEPKLDDVNPLIDPLAAFNNNWNQYGNHPTN
jgi:hypothetical protein